MSPKEILESLKENASERRARTLDVIYAICTEQEKQGQYDFSSSTISKLGFSKGVPKAQSLRNKSGEHYRALLNACEQKHSDKKHKPKGRSKSDWIDEIDNPKHRLLARMQASELKAANSKLTEFSPPGARIIIRDHQNNSNEEAILTDLERGALEYLISKKFLNKWNYDFGNSGQIIDANGKMVLKVATVDAIKKALNQLS